MAPIRKYRISAVKEFSASTRTFTFDPADGGIEGFRPGQFIFLHILDDKGQSMVKRPYSVASRSDEGKLELCIKLVGGELTGKLEKMGIGSVVGIEHAGGHFVYNDEKKAAFVAGGTGIAPIMCILRYIAKKKLDGEFVLFYSVRTTDSILYRDELEELEKMNPGIKVVITLTREEWEGEKGRICDKMIKKYIPKAGEFSWWICGPLSLAKGIKECLLSLGVDQQKIRIEGWG